MFDIARKITAGILMFSTIFMLTGCEPVQIKIEINIGGTGKSTPAPTKALMDPPGTDLANFDTTQGLLTMTLTNGAISSSSGPFTLTVIDHGTGQAVGQQSFNYVTVGNSLYAQDPTAVHNWLSTFSGYADVDVQMDVTPVIDALTVGTVSTTASLVYHGTPYASATASWEYGSDGGGGTCHTRICPNQ
jgi:hypothetical protein